MIAQIVAVATATKKALLEKEKKQKNKPTIVKKKKVKTIEELKQEGEFKGIIDKLL